jgi:hypothetical protein
MEYVVGGEFFSHLRKRVRFENNMARVSQCTSPHVTTPGMAPSVASCGCGW